MTPLGEVSALQAGAGPLEATMNDRSTNDNERQILADIGDLSDRLRQLRAAPHLDAPELRALEAKARLKWEELRSLRAGPTNAELTRPDVRGHYR